MNLHETSRRLMLLPPSSGRIPSFLKQVRMKTDWYHGMLHDMQRLRGQIYLEDGAIAASSLTADGRHHSDLDSSSWHLLVLDEQDRLCGCARFHEHPVSARSSMLNAARSALARDPERKDALFSALRAEVALARSANIPFVELGGWALGPEIRGTSEALRVSLATYAFWQMYGGAVSLTTATRRHCASSILRRIGGRSLVHDGIDLPAYYDPQYNCEMEILKFYSWSPNPRYSIWIEEMKAELREITVLANHSCYQEKAVEQNEWLPLKACAKTA